MRAPGLVGTRRELLNTLKARGPSTVPELAASAGLNVETVRHHMRWLTAEGLVQRGGTRRNGPGRPEGIHALTAEADALFPRREGEMLRALVLHLKETGREDLLEGFFESYIGDRRAAALARLDGLQGAARLEEASRILSELGFMAEPEPAAAGGIRLCHCPLREVVDVTKIPCRAELGFMRELLGGRLKRLSYIPAGDASCSYRGGPA